MTTTETIIYNNLLIYLEEHCTLNNNIPADVGCAEAVSFILQKSGFQMPTGGIPGTATLLQWLKSNPKFVQIKTPEPGALLVSATGTGNGTIDGHTGFFGKYGKMYPNDYGIVSNDSNTGLLLELWDWSRWQKYYVQQGQLETCIFRAL